MALVRIGVVIAVLLLISVYIASYRWLRRMLGEVEADAIPAARAVYDRRHSGYRQEPRWLRPLQATLLATGLTGAIAAALSFLAIASAMLLV